MTDPALDRALRKQRLVLRSAALRVHMGREAAALRPAFDRVDQARQVLARVRVHGPAIAAAAAALLVIRPRLLFRWSRRAWSAWQAWRRLRARLPGV